MVSFSVGVLRKIVVPDMYKALSIHKIRQNTKMPTFYKTLYLADGLKQLLIGSGFTLRSLLNSSTSDFAKILGIDEYVAKLVTDAVSKAIKRSRSIP